MPCRRPSSAFPAANATALCLCVVLTAPATGVAQDSGVFAGAVVAAESRAPLPAALVYLPDARRRILTGTDGRFRIDGLEPGVHRVLVETIGRVTVDTTVVVGAPGISVVLPMAARAIALHGIDVDVAPCSESGFDAAAGSAEAAAVLDELRKNAERYRATQEIEAPVLVMQRDQRLLRRNGRVARQRTDTIAADTTASSYRPGEVLVANVPQLIGLPSTHKMRLPGFQTLASDAFQDAHCFRYRGLDERDGERRIRIEYVPLLSIRTPDVRGSVYLNPQTFVVTEATFVLTNVPSTMPNLRSLTATVLYDEPVPGRVLIREIRSEQLLADRRTPTALELQKRVEYRIREEVLGSA